MRSPLANRSRTMAYTSIIRLDEIQAKDGNNKYNHTTTVIITKTTTTKTKNVVIYNNNNVNWNWSKLLRRKIKSIWLLCVTVETQVAARFSDGFCSFLLICMVFFSLICYSLSRCLRSLRRHSLACSHEWIAVVDSNEDETREEEKKHTMNKTAVFFVKTGWQ